MKRFFALAALLLGLAACQTEPEGLDVNVGGEVDTTITVAIPEGTRASSADGFNLSTLASTNYSLRYIVEVYRVNDDTVLYDTCQRFVETSDGTSMVFPVRLVPGYDYRIVAWTDIIEKNAANPKADRCYKTTDGLDAVEIIDGMWEPMDETRDAYTAVKVVDDFSSASNLDMTLTRPFAKLRVVATDITDITKVGLVPTSAEVEYSQDMFFKYNAVADVENKGTANDARAKSHTFTYPATPVYNDATGEYTLFADYFFVPSTGTAKFRLTVNAAAGLIKENNFNTEISVQRNKLTTIKGDVLTIGGNVEVKVENDLGQLETINYADNAETLQQIINNAPAGEQANITLGGDIVLGEGVTTLATTRAGEPSYGLLIPAGKKVVLDLNGHTIRQSKAQSGKYAMIENNGTLTICNSANTNGVISYGDTAILTADVGYASNTIQNNGTLTINEGVTLLNTSGTGVATYGYPHVIDTNGKLTINGGVLTNEANYSTMRIWCTTDDDTIVTINGGTFNGSIDFQTPNAAANKGTLTINGGTFNADTYTNCSARLLGFGADVDEMNGYINGGHFNGAIALKNWSGSELNSKVFNIIGGTFTTDPSEFVDDDYNVVENNSVYSLELKDVIAKIGEVEYRSLQKAFDAVDNGTIQLVGDVTLKSSVVLNEGKVATLDLNGKTITATDYAIENFGTLKINGNGTINGIVYCEATGNTTVENGTFNATESGKFVFLNSQGGTLTINGGTINGGSSYPIYSYDENSSLVINDVTVNATFGCVNAYGTNGSVVINGGTYQMTGVQGKTSHIAYFSNVDATINGGTFQKTGDINMSGTGGGGICAINGANLTINGGNFAGDHSDVYNWSGTNTNGRAVAISIKGGSYKFKPNAAFVAEGFKVENNNGRWTVVVDPAAKIGDTEYATLSEAFNVGGNITLLRDVTVAETVVLAEGKTVVLDLNGKTLSAVDMNTIKNNGGNLTIKNGTVTRTGDALGYSVNNASGEIAVENATIERGLYTSGSKMTATNANISHEQSSRHAIYAWDCEVTINSGTYHNDNAGNATLMASGSSVVTINGGTFSIADGRSTLGWTSCLLDSQNSATVIVNNGTYNGGFRVQAGTSMTINGGSFNDCYGSNYNIYGTVTVKGGTYTDDTAKTFANKYIAEGYKLNNEGQVVETQMNNQIWYVSDEMALEPTNPDALGGAKVVSNVWDKTTGKGVITFDRDLTTIGEKAFQRVTHTTPSNWATSITLPESVETIGDYAFAQCDSLTTINIPDSVTSIGQYAFQSCDAVTSVTIGSGVTSIGSSAFYNCYEINEIICESTTAPALADKWVFNGVQPERVVVPAVSVNAYKAAWSMFADKIVAGEF